MDKQEYAVEETTSIYFGIIGECRKRVDVIRNKVSIITSPRLETIGQANTPDRTELEAQLKSLLSKIKELENDIVV